MSPHTFEIVNPHGRCVSWIRTAARAAVLRQLPRGFTLRLAQPIACRSLHEVLSLMRGGWQLVTSAAAGLGEADAFLRANWRRQSVPVPVVHQLLGRGLITVEERTDEEALYSIAEKSTSAHRSDASFATQRYEPRSMVAG